ncbi:MAG: hypothetical protein WCT23_08265 [Candidatus Neomarinimicrobiota bacterium]
MKKFISIVLCLNFILLSANGLAFKGTARSNISYSNNFSTTAQFIPQLSADLVADTSRYICDFELSANTFLSYNGKNEFNGDFLPYRAWARFAGDQFEFRVGLQKITFGKAQLLRSLSWFDSIDPRDPLGLTQGVFAERFRYYIPNSNANIWLWAIQEKFISRSFHLPFVSGNNGLIRQYGGRFELPVFQGEMGLSYNYKAVRSDFAITHESLSVDDLHINKHQIAFDGKWDNIIGAWLELAYTQEGADFTFLSDKTYASIKIAQLTLGMDYTFGIGNGLLLTAEYLAGMIKSDSDFGAGASSIPIHSNIAALMLAYSLGIFDSIGFMNFLDLDKGDYYAYIFWQKQFDHLTFRLSGALTAFDADANLFLGEDSGVSLGNMIELIAIYDFKADLFR